VDIQYSQIVTMFLHHGAPKVGLYSFRVLNQHPDSAVKTGVVSTISTSLCPSERIFSRLLYFIKFQGAHIDFTFENVSFLRTTDNSLSNLPFENTTHKFTMKMLLCAIENCGSITVKSRM
jgi:hypothetical protein